MGREDLVVVSNRGPLSFYRDDKGDLVPRRGAGGLVSALGPLLPGTNAIWVAAALSEEDKEAAKGGLVEVEGLRLRSLALERDEYRMAYDVVSNATLWFLHHGLFDLARRPRFDRRWRQSWEAYTRVNRAFAEMVAEAAPEQATVLVQDYHLALVGGFLVKLRPDVRTVHFSHTPFAGPSAMRVLPDDVAMAILEGMAATRACGFHSSRWSGNFEMACKEILGNVPRTFVAPLGPDPLALETSFASEACKRELANIQDLVGDRKMVLRVDRVELSKNLLRGFLAFDELLTIQPELHEKVVFLALSYASRQGLAEYLAYQTEVEAVATQVNEKWATSAWTPVLLDVADNYPRSVAALSIYDVLLVNPISDGLNLVAMEGPALNRRHGLLALSRQAGSWDMLEGAALGLNPFDLSDTASVLLEALSMEPEPRRQRAEALRDAAKRRSPRAWLEDQLAAAAG